MNPELKVRVDDSRRELVFTVGEHEARKSFDDAMYLAVWMIQVMSDAAVVQRSAEAPPPHVSRLDYEGVSV